MAKRFSSTTVDNNIAYINAFRRIKNIDGSFVKIGINDKEGSQIHPGNPSDGRRNQTSRTTIAEVGFFNEFGTAQIPERSFIRTTVDEKRSSFERTRNRELSRILLSETSVRSGLDRLGFAIQEEIKKKIITTSSPPNSEGTRRIKGFNNPLIDSETMLNSIKFETTIK